MALGPITTITISSFSSSYFKSKSPFSFSPTFNHQTKGPSPHLHNHIILFSSAALSKSAFMCVSNSSWRWWWCRSFLFSLITFSVASDPFVSIPNTISTSSSTSIAAILTSSSSSYSSSSSNSVKLNHDHTNKRSFVILTTASVSGVLLLLLLAMCLYFKCFRFINIRRKRRSKRVEDANDEEYTIPLPTTTSAVVVNISSSLDPLKSPPKNFSWEEIEKLALNCSNVIGHGGFSTVYLARFVDSNLAAALKIISNRNSSERLKRMFEQELQILLKLGHHSNIVNLIGYCDAPNEDSGVLVLEYVPNGNLHNKLHSDHDGGMQSSSSSSPLSWRSRMKIAFQLGRAIEYLHDKCSLQIVHGDIKASNILLDNQFNCKLCDFGSANMGFSSMVVPSSNQSMMMMGSLGYMDPHYLKTGLSSKKNDVYSFGVLILELITGIEAFCSRKQQLLTTIAASMLADPNLVAQMVDPRIKNNNGDFNVEEAKVMACVAAQCILQQPSLRPSMADILHTMTQHGIFSEDDEDFVATDIVKPKEEEKQQKKKKNSQELRSFVNI